MEYHHWLIWLYSLTPVQPAEVLKVSEGYLAQFRVDCYFGITAARGIGARPFVAESLHDSPELRWWLWGVSSANLTLHPSLQRLNVLPTVGASLDWTVPEVCDAPTHTKFAYSIYLFVMLLIWKEWDSECNTIKAQIRLNVMWALYTAPIGLLIWTPKQCRTFRPNPFLSYRTRLTCDHSLM